VGERLEDLGPRKEEQQEGHGNQPGQRSERERCGYFAVLRKAPG
jgi:hypothetical protein